MKLGIKIILPILLLLVIILGEFWYLLHYLKQQETVISAQEEKIQKQYSLSERLSRYQEQTFFYTLSYRINQSKSFLYMISQAELEKSRTLDEIFPFISTTRGRELVNNYIDARREIDPVQNALIAAITEKDEKQINLEFIKWSIKTENIKAALADLKAYNINSLEQTIVIFNDVGNEISQVIIILVLITFVTILLLYFYLRAVISVPLIHLAAFADQLAKIDFSSSSSSSSSKNNNNSNDEIGLLYRSLYALSRKLKSYYGNLEQKVKEHTEELSRKVSDLEDSKKATMNVLEDLGIEKSKVDLEKSKDEAILASVGDGVIVTDNQSNITMMNQAAEKMLGWKTHEILGKPGLRSLDIRG